MSATTTSPRGPGFWNCLATMVTLLVARALPAPKQEQKETHDGRARLHFRDIPSEIIRKWLR